MGHPTSVGLVRCGPPSPTSGPNAHSSDGDDMNEEILFPSEVLMELNDKASKISIRVF